MTTERTFDADAFLATLTRKPGVYRMVDEEGAVLYVGKARNLKARVSNYFRASGLEPGDEVVAPTHTFVATTEGVTQAGGSVRLSDDQTTLGQMSVTSKGRWSPVPRSRTRSTYFSRPTVSDA